MDPVSQQNSYTIPNLPQPPKTEESAITSGLFNAGQITTEASSESTIIINYLTKLANKTLALNEANVFLCKYVKQIGDINRPVAKLDPILINVIEQEITKNNPNNAPSTNNLALAKFFNTPIELGQNIHMLHAPVRFDVGQDDINLLIYQHFSSALKQNNINLGDEYNLWRRYSYIIQDTSQYRIEAALYRINVPFFGQFGHDFWVLKNGEGREVAQLHGFATDHRTGAKLPIGTHPENLLKVFHETMNRDFATKYGLSFNATGSGLVVSSAMPIYQGKDALLRWWSAVSGIPELNKQRVRYPIGSISVVLGGREPNSNSVYTLLGGVMQIDRYAFPGINQPGINNVMVDSTLEGKLKYLPLA